MRTVTFLVIYHFSINDNDLISTIEDAIGFSLSNYSKINDDNGEYNILFWDNMTAPNNFKANAVKRKIHQKISKVKIQIIEHRRGFWETYGAFIGIGLTLLSAILGVIALYR